MPLTSTACLQPKRDSLVASSSYSASTRNGQYSTVASDETKAQEFKSSQIQVKLLLLLLLLAQLSMLLQLLLLPATAGSIAKMTASVFTVTLNHSTASHSTPQSLPYIPHLPLLLVSLSRPWLGHSFAACLPPTPLPLLLQGHASSAAAAAGGGDGGAN
jgi:hypothetical protein